jgi:hypothetical protein
MALYFPSASTDILRRMCNHECPESAEKKYVDDPPEADQFIRRDF